MSHIRVESHEKVVGDARVFYVNGDEEIDISSCVQVVDLHLGVGEVATATLQAVVRHVRKPTPFWRRLFRRHPSEITTVSDRTRRWA